MLSLNNILTSPDERFKITVDEASNTYSLRVSNSIQPSTRQITKCVYLRLQILDLKKDDSGRYRCQINIDMNNNVGKEIDLQVTRPATFLDSSERSYSVAEGQAVTLFCAADGFPRPEVTWRRDNDELLSSKEFIFK
jgi:hypothetical protein